MSNRRFRVGEHAGELPADRVVDRGHLELCQLPGGRACGSTGDRSREGDAIVAGSPDREAIRRRQWVVVCSKGKVLPAMLNRQLQLLSPWSAVGSSASVNLGRVRRPRFRGAGQGRSWFSPTGGHERHADRGWPRRLRRNAARHVPAATGEPSAAKAGRSPHCITRHTADLRWHDRQRVPDRQPTAPCPAARLFAGFCWGRVLPGCGGAGHPRRRGR